MGKLPSRSLGPLIKELNKKPSISRRVYAGIASHLAFCTLAVREVYHRSKWRGLMEATHRGVKIGWGIFISAGGLGMLAIFITYVWPLLGKRWWAIIFLTLLSLALIGLNGIVKTLHETAIKDHRIEKKKLADQIKENAKIVLFEREQKETARDFLSKSRDEIGALTTERDALKLELIALKTPGLYFEVDWPRCHVRAIVDSRFDRVAIESNLTLRFCKRGPLSVMGKKVEIDLHETRDDGEAKRINSRGDGVRLRTGPLRDKDVVFAGLEFTKPMSPDYDLFERIIVYDPINSLSDLVNKKHFLRFTVEASNQEPLSVDFDVDWKRYGRLMGPR